MYSMNKWPYFFFLLHWGLPTQKNFWEYIKGRGGDEKVFKIKTRARDPNFSTPWFWSSCGACHVLRSWHEKWRHHAELFVLHTTALRKVIKPLWSSLNLSQPKCCGKCLPLKFHHLGFESCSTYLILLNGTKEKLNNLVKFLVCFNWDVN